MRELARRRFAVTFAPRRVGWWLLIAASLVGAGMAVSALLPGARVFPVAAVMGLVFTAPLLLGWWLLLRLPQLWFRVSGSGAIAAMAWGAFAAAGIYALPANSALITVLGQHLGIDAAQQWGAALIAPLTEETGKAFGIVVVLLAAGQRLRTPMDAALLGAFCAVGFTATEDMLYGLNIAYLNLGENQVISTTVIYAARAIVFGPVSHIVFSSVVGAGIGVLAVGRRRGRIPMGIALITLGAGLHGLWNSPWLGAVWTRVVYLVVVPFVVWAVLRYLRTEEHRWFTEVLGRPGALGAVPATYVGTVGATWWKRRAYRKGVVEAFGEEALELQRVLEAELTDLAEAVDTGDDESSARIRRSLEARLALPS
ncbi:PrsW family intramembrane metalloprotease [Demequina lutea]|uniref:RsiW-degrading membrane proteinase PrsW (M82 family) n=1 Tax=Demequina lutea TaxID=431489 RepID=A0A7Y9ZAF7_9MICO|nr:PrsW family intramembrane metalloprotease [Demequina lutea]NYI40480.1 RsiW-degrading membrane proteinase PrsW (M82 family) [Demequina lutea]